MADDSAVKELTELTRRLNLAMIQPENLTADVAKRNVQTVDALLHRSWTVTNPRGGDPPKDAQLKALSNPARNPVKVSSGKVSNIKVRVYGNAAVVTARCSVKGSYKKEDISGDYAITDMWIKERGKWQVVASHASEISE